MIAPSDDVTADGTPAVLSLYLLRSAAIIAFGSLLFGFEMAVISGTTGWLKSQFALSDFELGFAVASGLIGAIVGSVLIAHPADIFGRRNVLFALALLFLVQAIGCALAWNLESFVLFRLIGGIAVGGASVAAPVYITELAPARYRGRLVTITQLNIVLGILLSYLSNYLIGRMGLGADEARWMFGVMAAPPLIFFLALFLTPHSPRWLIGQGRVDEARQVFERCGTDKGSVDAEIAAISRALAQTPHQMTEPLFDRRYRKPISLAITIAVFNQICGINAVLYYAPQIFTMAGAGKASALLQSVLIGSVLLVFTVAALAAIDRMGRRRLLLIGSVGYVVSLSVAAWALHTGAGGWPLLASLLLFVASHAFSQGAVIWVFIGEIFPTPVRARGQALGSFTHWVTGALVSWSFPVLLAQWGGLVFAIYALCMVGQFVWALTVMPETKGLSLEDIQQKLRLGAERDEARSIWGRSDEEIEDQRPHR